MTGKQQHHIPNFLQCGFHIEGTENVVFYRKGEEPVTTGSSNVAKQNYFYTDSTELEADTKITDEENLHYSGLIGELRECTGILDKSRSAEIAKMVQHMCTRTLALRSGLEELGQAAFENTGDAVGPLVDQRINNPQGIRKAAMEQLDSFDIPLSMKEHIVQQLDYVNMEEIGELVKERMQEGLRSMEFDSKADAKKSHISLLLKDSKDHARIEEYKGLHWEIAEAENLILGDSICMFQTDGPRQFTILNDSGNSLLAVYLPISESKILIGKASSAFDTPTIPQIRRELARASTFLFIGFRDCQELRILSNEIGSNSCLLTREEMDASFRDAINDAGKFKDQ